MWDRDGFVAVNRYLLAWSGPSEGDAEVQAALARLLCVVPEPSESVGPLRAAVLRLAAAGHFAAGHALARVAGGHPEGKDLSEEQADLIETWRAAVSWISETGALTDDERERVIERLARQLAQPRGTAAWRELLREARAVLGERVALFAAEAWQGAEGDAGRDAGRATAAAKIDSLAGGTILALDGIVSPEGGDVRVALFDGERSIEQGALALIEASSIAWRTADDGTRSFTAAFAAGSLPMHRPLTPVMIEGDRVWNIDATLELPPYSRHDSFLYDVVDRILVIRKRRHWTIRGAMIVARKMLRR